MGLFAQYSTFLNNLLGVRFHWTDLPLNALFNGDALLLYCRSPNNGLTLAASSHGQRLPPNVVNWPQYDVTNQNYLVISEFASRRF